jgi:hypothetical protein
MTGYSTVWKFTSDGRWYSTLETSFLVNTVTWLFHAKNHDDYSTTASEATGCGNFRTMSAGSVTTVS